MPRKLRKQVDVVQEISSSDDEDQRHAKKAVSNKTALQSMPREQQQQQRRREGESAAATAPSFPVNEALESRFSRSFWKAGDCSVGPTTQMASDQESLEYARVHPKFLHSNATSHKWAFGAIAELLDNAVDEVQNGATYVKVDKIDIMKDGSPALLFQDDGGGMDPECLRKCMSLGYSTKKASRAIGQYGNGFKTSTMRLGADVIVFSRANRARATQSVGLLSYTFLRKTGQDDVIVPMIDFDITSHFAEPIIQSSNVDWSFNLNTLLEWSPFASKDELLQQFEDIGPHGTKVIVYNLWLNDEGIYELSFDDDDEDIRLRDEANSGNLKKLHKKILELQSHISYRLRYSLRAYASMLYLRKFENFKIVLRGKPVQQFNIVDELRFPEVVKYKPQIATPLKEATVETTIGLLKEAPAATICGFNVYHKNRLIRPFWKVTGDGSVKGNGVVGVLEVNFLEPTHDKQDFERSSVFVRMESRLKQMIIDYWKKHYHLSGHHLPGSSEHNEQKKVLGQQPLVKHVVNTQKQLFPDIGPASNIQEEMSLDQPFIGLQENVTKDVRTGQPAIQPSIGVTDGFHNEVESEDRLMSMSIDQICEENIELFTRCEEHRQKENELKQLVEELEKQLEQAKRKCAQLSLHLEARKKQMASEHVEKVP